MKYSCLVFSCPSPVLDLSESWSWRLRKPLLSSILLPSMLGILRQIILLFAFSAFCGFEWQAPSESVWDMNEIVVRVCVWPSSGPSLMRCLPAGPSTWLALALRVANIPSILTRARDCDVGRISTVLNPFLSIVWWPVKECNWILNFRGGGEKRLTQKWVCGCDRALVVYRELACWLVASCGLSRLFLASCSSSLPWKRLQMCSFLLRDIAS